MRREALEERERINMELSMERTALHDERRAFIALKLELDSAKHSSNFSKQAEKEALKAITAAETARARAEERAARTCRAPISSLYL
tara:strand:+ start:215 stop:472 length:258 start_codon:yes stop_codon:yes gene_type:complete